MKKIRNNLLIIMAISVGIIVILSMISEYRSRTKKGPFFRQFRVGAITNHAESLDLGYNSFYIAGITPNRIYLGNSTAPFAVWTLDTGLSNLQSFPLIVTDTSGIALRAPSLLVTPPNFYLMDGTVTPAAILTGNTETWKATPVRSNRAYFTGSVAMSPRSFIHRSVVTKTRENELGKETLYPQQFTIAPALLEKQVDGLFCTDGMLLYNRRQAKLIYTYYYRNEFIVADTNLNLVYRGHTIDTISRAQLRISNVRSNGTTTFSAPPATVNAHSCTDGRWLFIHSNIMGHNDSPQRFDKAAAIDAYDLQHGKYAFSFYLPNRGREKLRQFRVIKNTLVALFGSELVKYQLNLPQHPVH